MYSYYKSNKTFVWIYGTFAAGMILFFTYIFGMYDNIGNVGKILVFSESSIEEHYVFKIGNICYIKKYRWGTKIKSILHKNGTIASGDYGAEYNWILSTDKRKISSDDRFWFNKNCVDPVDEVSHLYP